MDQVVEHEATDKIQNEPCAASEENKGEENVAKNDSDDSDPGQKDDEENMLANMLSGD
jgi:hypothetical protein